MLNAVSFMKRIWKITCKNGPINPQLGLSQKNHFSHINQNLIKFQGIGNLNLKLIFHHSFSRGPSPHVPEI